MNLSHDQLRAVWQGQLPTRDAARSGCLTDREWPRLFSNDTDRAERARVARHLASCRACAETYRSRRPCHRANVERNQGLPQLLADSAHRWWWAGQPSWPSRLVALPLAVLALLLVTDAMTFRFLLDLKDDRDQAVKIDTQRSLTLAAPEPASLMNQTTPRVTVMNVQNPKPGTEAWVKRIEQSLAARLDPQLDVNIVNLPPSADVRDAPVEPTIVAARAPFATVVFVVHFSPLPSRAMLEIELRSDDGRTRWVNQTNREPGTARLTLALSTEKYRPGAYVIRLYDVTRARTVIGTYHIRIQQTPDDRE